MYKQTFINGYIVDLNDRFRNRELLPGEFYEQFETKGFNLPGCVLVSIFPDGDDTYCGRVIRQDGDVFKFDVDLAASCYSSWTNITVEFKTLYEKRRLTKPWSSDVVAFDIFKERQVT